MSEPLLALRGVAGGRGGRVLFEGVELALHAGDAAAVTGPNGAGKSTLLRIAAGLLRPAAGAVSTSGAVALLGENSALDPERRLADALAFWARLDGAVDPKSRVGEALSRVELAPLADLPVRMLSTGQRRRAGLARVLVSTAPIWLLDEPANGLDTASIARLETLIAAHRASGGVALVASHLPFDLPNALSIPLGAAEPVA